LGFQYHALFQPKFDGLPDWRKALELAALALLLVALVLMIAPAGFHQIAEAGETTERQRKFVQRSLEWSLAPFAAAIGLNVLVAAGSELGTAAGAAFAGGAILVALFLWYGVEMMVRRPDRPAEPSRDSGAETSLKDKISDLMTEGRIVLPGVQALLGFQFAAYLTDAFAKASPGARLAHSICLGLLLLSMILLMTPAPFHRLAEHGQDTERVCRVSARLLLCALASLALAVATDVYVAVDLIVKRSDLAVIGAVAAAVFAFAIWFAYPLLARARRGQGSFHRAEPSH
jgi:fumarate reductase subunit D